MSQRNIPNTFAPHVRNKFLSVSDVIVLLYRQFVKFENLPEEVKEAINRRMAELTHQATSSGEIWDV